MGFSCLHCCEVNTPEHGSEVNHIDESDGPQEPARRLGSSPAPRHLTSGTNFLLLNSEKTEVLIIGPKNHKSNNLEHCLRLDGCSLDSLSSVRNLGVLFDSNLSFDSHVSSICKTAFFHLKNISKLRPMSSMPN